MRSIFVVSGLTQTVPAVFYVNEARHVINVILHISEWESSIGTRSATRITLVASMPVLETAKLVSFSLKRH